MDQDLKSLIRQVRTNVLKKHGNVFLDVENVKRLPEQEQNIREEVRVITGGEDKELENKIVDNIIGFGKIAPLLKDKWLNEVMINGTEVWVDRKGELVKTDINFDNEKEVELLLQRIVQMSSRKIDWASPMVDAKLPDGSRVNAVIKPSSDYPAITIRRFPEHSFSIEELIEQGYLSEEMAIFFDYIVKGRLNILLCGAAGSSKTTCLRTLAGKMIPESERIITIEDNKELNIKHPHCISLEASDKASVHDLTRNALRMRPDRILIGECRGMETFELLQAMGTGHDGSITTAHTNNGKMDAFQRLMRAMIKSGLSDRELMSQLCSALDITVFLKKFKNGKYKISHVCEVVNNNGTPEFKEIYTYNYSKGKHVCKEILTGELLERIKNNLETNSLPNIKPFQGKTERVVNI